MKGYVFSVGSDFDAAKSLGKGVFGVLQESTTALWNWQMIETFADYAGMEEGDLVFFFQKRRIYGVGRLAKPKHWPAAVIWNRPDGYLAHGAGKPLFAPDGRAPPVLFHFVPHPVFFKQGIDMDEVLADANARPDWALRFFWKRSFIQLDEHEAKTILATFVRKFPGEISVPTAKSDEPPSRPGLMPFAFADIIRQNASFVSSLGGLAPEAVLHGALVSEITQNGLPCDRRDERTAVVIHEAPASPPKPADYIDRIDILRARCLSGSPGGIPHHWDIVESKAGIVSLEAGKAVLGQVMKYVDFVAREKCAGDYGAVSGHIVARGYEAPLIRFMDDAAAEGRLSRAFVTDPHSQDAIQSWHSLRLWTYQWDQGLRLEKAWQNPRLSQR